MSKAMGQGYGKWTNEQRQDYLDAIDHLIKSLQLVILDSDSRPSEKRSAAKELLDAKERRYDVENSMVDISDVDLQIERLTRKNLSLTHELEIYRARYGEILDNYSGVEDED